ncbi:MULTISPECIES: Gfo/Idh/MocA family oxidoreductase [unclassified Sphingobacterium]|uniref:Gfo/Idh/MocA family oxidoreductase n=1 Tax=unclassified Sphingobacterium TaxID=2609468 RepID=UPI00104F5416|nr:MULTISPECIES: Gfo/Idh/MocA family oxidoreductase [unclassified Sphingobacterium]MCS3557355.1 putative dehydrogenase [Sphingobacterium sp. JUb21]TCR01578.1 putative dehydrogenase [Sphingobacterium sp. JUb20]
MTVNKIITGVLSYGMSGRVFHTPFIANNDRFELRAVVERSTKKAQLDYPSIISYDSVEELLADDAIELVIINTPNDTHVSLAKQALLAGKHVLIEKPFAPTVLEAKELFDLGRKVGKFVLPYHNRRFDSDFNSLKSVLECGKVGEPVELHLRFDRYRAEIGQKVFKETKRPAAGILFDLGSHLLDQVISLFGKPLTAVKRTSIHRKDSEVDDFATLLLTFDHGLTVFITVSMLVLESQYSFLLHGTQGTFVKDRTDVQENQLIDGISPIDEHYGEENEHAEGLLTYLEQGNMVSERLKALKGNYMLLFDAVYDQIRNDKAYFVTEEQIYWQLEILE